MKILITGANGFLGKFLTDAALNAGHDVRAVVRPANKGKDLGFDENANLEFAYVDLRQAKDLENALNGVDVVIHSAATKAGDFYTQFAGTVVGTENLLRAMKNAGVNNLVGISTFSVYEYIETKNKTLIDEDAQTVIDPSKRDEYAQTKLEQEKLYSEFAEEDADHNCVIIRPGMIYGPGELWHALLGSPFGPVFLQIGSKSTLPMTFVGNCAEAIVLAAEKANDKQLNGEIINIVDDDLPSQKDYAKAVQEKMETPRSIKIPWALWKTATATMQKTNDVALKGKAKFPGLFVPSKLHARFKPLTYTNAKAKDKLGWQPRYTLEEAIDLSIELEAKQTQES